MGIDLVAAAVEFGRSFNERARAAGTRQLEPLELLVLQRMAFVARDTDKTPTYYAGREATLSALGLPSTDSARRRLMRATSELVAAGAITRSKQGYRGSTTVYRLIYKRGREVVPIVENRVTPKAPQHSNGYHQRPEWVPPAAGMGTTTPPPKEERGQEEEGDARETVFELTAPTAPTPTPPSWDSDLPEPQTGREAARCAVHPHGTTGPCWTCGDNRRAWETEHPGAPAHRPKPSRYNCAAGRHRVVSEKSPGIPDDICTTCGARGVVDAFEPAKIGANA